MQYVDQSVIDSYDGLETVTAPDGQQYEDRMFFRFWVLPQAFTVIKLIKAGEGNQWKWHTTHLDGQSLMGWDPQSWSNALKDAVRDSNRYARKFR